MKTDAWCPTCNKYSDVNNLMFTTDGNITLILKCRHYLEYKNLKLIHPNVSVQKDVSRGKDAK